MPIKDGLLNQACACFTLSAHKFFLNPAQMQGIPCLLSGFIHCLKLSLQDCCLIVIQAVIVCICCGLGV